MIWKAISYHEVFVVVCIKGNMDSTQYCKILDEMFKESAGVYLGRIGF